MKRCLLFLSVFAALCANAQQIAKNLTASNNVFIGFYEYKPVDYNDDPQKKYPVIIFLHGLGERGNGLDELPRVCANGIPKNIKNGHPMRFFWNGKWETFLVLTPQLSKAYGSWPIFYVEEMMKYARQNLRVDTNRVFLTGLSLGGSGVWGYPAASLSNAQKLAAMAVVCGISSSGNYCNIAKANLPVWAFHAQDDGTVNISTTNTNINKIIACGPEVMPYKSIYPTGGHGIWGRSYDVGYGYHNPNIYEWFLGQDKSLPVNKRPKANAGSNLTISSATGTVNLSGVLSQDEDGTIVRYIWKFITGPVTPTVSTPVSTHGQTSVSGLVMAGTYTFELKAVDDRADWTMDTVTLTVSPLRVSNIPPVTEAGDDQEIATTRTTLKGSGSYDPDGFIKSFKWRKVQGPAQYSISNDTLASPEVFNLGPGTYQFELKTTDNSGASSSDTVTIEEGTIVLGIKMDFFRGVALSSHNELNWKTILEDGITQFEVERSVDGSRFQTIGRLAASGSTMGSSYRFSDSDPQAGASFYRLKQINQKGVYEYSSIIKIDRGVQSAVVRMYPVPVRNELTIEVQTVTTTAVSLRLYQSGGKLINQQQLGAGTNRKFTIDMSSYPAGVYLAEITNENGLKEIQKIIKQ